MAKIVLIEDASGRRAYGFVRFGWMDGVKAVPGNRASICELRDSVDRVVKYSI